MNRIYLDNNSTTAILPEVVQAMSPYLAGFVGNASSLHADGRRARKAVESAREQIANLLDARPAQLFFTSGGTEANNLAIFGLAGSDPAPIAASTIEHPSVQACIQKLSGRGYQVAAIAVDHQGVVDDQSFQTALATAPRLVCVMLANNETGAIQPIAELAQAARSRGILFHCDAVQMVGKLPVSFRSLGVSTLSLSAHKFHGPVGVGALIAESSERISPMLIGGHQQGGLRAGTEPVALIVGMAAALELAASRFETAEQLRSMTKSFVERVQAVAGPALLNGPDCRLPNTVNLQFPGIDGQAAVVALDLAGVSCSTGSACASGSPGLSPTLLAMGLSSKQARSSIRFSFDTRVTEAELEQAVSVIARVMERLRATQNTTPPALR